MLRPADWSDEIIEACLSEMKLSNEVLIGASKEIPLPMPNLVYLACTLLQHSQDPGRLDSVNSVMCMCTELHKLLVAEIVARKSGQSVKPIPLCELLSRSRTYI